GGGGARRGPCAGQPSPGRAGPTQLCVPPSGKPPLERSGGGVTSSPFAAVAGRSSAAPASAVSGAGVLSAPRAPLRPASSSATASGSTALSSSSASAASTSD